MLYGCSAGQRGTDIMSDNNIIRDEGKSGLNYAYNSNGDLVKATDAISSVIYTCPCDGCGAKLHVMLTKRGAVFARYKLEVHLNPICRSIESGAQEKTFENLTPEGFIGKLCRRVQRQPKKPPVVPPTPGKDPGTSSIPPTEPDRTASFSSLKQIAKSQVQYLKPNDRYGDHRVSDFILTYKYAFEFFRQEDFSLECRIVYARYRYSYSHVRALEFVLFSGSDYVLFLLSFNKQNDYKKYRDQFVTFELNTETGKKMPRFTGKSEVLIASDMWNPLSEDQYLKLINSKNSNYAESEGKNAKTLRSGNCYGIYQAVFTNEKQIYIYPNDD